MYLASLCLHLNRVLNRHAVMTEILWKRLVALHSASKILEERWPSTRTNPSQTVKLTEDRIWGLMRSPRFSHRNSPWTSDQVLDPICEQQKHDWMYLNVLWDINQVKFIWNVISSFTHPYVFPNLYVLFLSWTTEGFLKNIFATLFNIMKVNEDWGCLWREKNEHKSNYHKIP